MAHRHLLQKLETVESWERVVESRLACSWRTRVQKALEEAAMHVWLARFLSSSTQVSWEVLGAMAVGAAVLC